MPKFSNRSVARLSECDNRLQTLAQAVVLTTDCTVVCGHRSADDQNKAYADGKSKLQYPKSKHNKYPSVAMDLAPYINGRGVVWDADQCYFFAGKVMQMAQVLEIPIRWGGDWDEDGDVNDQSFNDLVHFELDI